jgi:hypothetical protein
MPFALSGEEGRVEIEARGIRHEIAFRIDRIAQQPVIDHEQHPGSVRTGTSITVHWPESSRLGLEDAGPRFLPIIQRFTDLNPHLSICATWQDEDRHERWSREAESPGWTKWTPSAPTCPHWYRIEHLERLAGAFLHHDRERKAVRLLRDFVAEFNGLSGTAKRKAVLDAVGLQRAPLARLLDREDFDHELVGRLLSAMQDAARPIKPERLGPLGREILERTFAAYQGDPETFRYKLLKGVDGGVPWLVETAFAYRPQGHWRVLLCGVNWSPSLDADGDPFRLGYELGASYCGSDEPIVLLAHLICPRPEFVDRGKSSLARHSPGYGAIADAVADVTADWAKQRKSEIRDRKREQNRWKRMQRQQVRETSLKDLVLKHLPTTIVQVSQSGRLSFTQRDLFYTIRPLVRQEHDKPITYSYFKVLLTDIEAEQGEIAGMLREPRGSLYHPHLRETIPLSTESVAAYRRPFWTFNKMLYIEKAGTQKNLIETGWPEQFDCAIANTGGFTTRAVKDLFDLLAISSEPVTVFCIHDADAAGTMIHHTLQNETKARGARKVEIVNLGLEPWEGVGMGLDVEAVEGIERNRPVAPYVAEHDRGASWCSWLQRHRIELNAMPPADRIAWITRKIEQFPPRKVIPPSSHTVPELREKAQAFVRSALTDELTRRAAIDERVAAAMGSIQWSWPKPEAVTAEIEQGLKAAPRAQWSGPLHLFARRIALPMLKRALADLDDEAPP